MVGNWTIQTSKSKRRIFFIKDYKSFNFEFFNNELSKLLKSEKDTIPIIQLYTLYLEIFFYQAEMSMHL